MSESRFVLETRIGKDLSLTKGGLAPEVLGGKFGRVRRETLLEKVGDQVRHDD